MCAQGKLGAVAQRRFATPMALVQATMEAAERGDPAGLMALFGAGGAEIVDSGDAQRDAELRREFVQSAKVKVHLHEDALWPDRMTYAVGEQEWPFPVPMIRREGQWQYDTARGRLEVLARRIGRNQLNAVDVCRGYAEAQREYSTQTHDGGTVLQYALDAHALPVPVGFVAACGSGKGTRPAYHGYLYRVLDGQGAEATGGAFDYMVKGRMIGGFALVAWPAEYGHSGILTMAINHEGVVYQKDLGAGTSAAVGLIQKFNPDKTWRAAWPEAGVSRSGA